MLTMNYMYQGALPRETIVPVTMILTLPFIILNSAFYANYLKERNFVNCYSINIIGYLVGVLGALIWAFYWGFHQLLILVIIFWIVIFCNLYRRV
ncbi:MAG: hypothetical protein IT287_07955 [Bdellovibrionaceae bacterium]|nr:hypothetical protein [Pseudobdellovibrionaceae bacterium]